MATVSNASPVLPAGYYTSQGLQSLTLSQQAAANGQQSFLTSRQNLFSSLFGNAATSSPTALGVQINGASTPGQLAAQAGAATLQQSQSNLLGSMTATSGWFPSSIFQLKLVQSLTKSGLLGYAPDSSPTAAQTAATGEADQTANEQLLVNSLSDPNAGSGTAFSSYLSGLYSRISQFSLVPRGTGVGANLDTTA